MDRKKDGLGVKPPTQDWRPDKSRGDVHVAVPRPRAEGKHEVKSREAIERRGI